MSIEYVDSSLPGQQAINRLYKNDQKLSGKADQGLFDELELDDIYDRLGNRKYERNVLLGNTLATYTNWSNVTDESGYGIWKYPVSVFTDDEDNELYLNDVKLNYKGEASSESTPLGFTGVYLSDSKRGAETFTDVTTEAGTLSGTPYNLAISTSYVSSVTPTLSGVDLDYFNIIEGSVTVETLASAVTQVTYVEDTDYEIDYVQGSIALLSGTSISGVVQVSYNVGNSLYIGLSGVEFESINVGLAQRGVGNVYGYDYYQSGVGWSTFSPDIDATNGYSNSGNIQFSGLTGWASTNVNSQAGYYIRQRFTIRGSVLPTGYYTLQAGSSATTLLTLTGKEIKENSYKWCYYNDYVYVTIPNMGASNQEGSLYIKSSSATDNKKNYFIYNNTYKSNYRNTTTSDDIVIATKTPSSVSDTGTAGTIVWDANYIYVCTATNQWKRTSITTW